MGLFPRWATGVFRLAIIGTAATVLVVIPVALFAWVRTPYVTGEGQPIKQPIPFDHRHHVVDDRIDCRYCHNTVERSASAGYPASEVCMSCHGQIWGSSPILEPVRQSFFEKRPLAWKRVYKLPDFVYFNHSIHVAKGVACEVCHGRIDTMARIYQTAPLTMSWCLSCHREPQPFVRAPEDVTVMGWRPPTDPAGRERLAEARASVHPRTNCTTCHR